MLKIRVLLKLAAGCESNSEYSASMILARCRETPAGNQRWRLRFDESLNPDIIIAARLKPGNEDIVDFYLMRVPRQNSDLLMNQLDEIGPDSPLRFRVRLV
jgi:hypothetical protein